MKILQSRKNIEKTIQITELGVGKPTASMPSIVRMDSNVVMAAEALPSLNLKSGELLVNLSSSDSDNQAKLERIYHDLIESNMRTEDGNDFALACVGLKFRDKVTAPSSYKGHIGWVEQFNIGFISDPKELVVAAAIKGYVQDQEAVTIRSLVPSKVGSNDIWSFDCGRIITHSEMVNITSELKKSGINPDNDDVALVTSKDGIDILNIKTCQSMFRKIPNILSGVLKGKVYACNNEFGNEEYHYGYIGADSLNEAQSKYLEIIAEFNSYNSQSEVCLDLLDQKRKEIREITNKFIAQYSRIEVSIERLSDQPYAA